MRGFHQVRHGLLAAQHAESARGPGARFHAAARGGELAQRGDHLGTHGHVGVDHLVVGVREHALDARADALQRADGAGLHVTRIVEVDQTVRGARLHFRIVVARGFNQRIQASRRADFRELLHGFQAHIPGRVLQESLKPGNGAGAALADLANILGADILRAQNRKRANQGDNRNVRPHSSMLSRVGCA